MSFGSRLSMSAAACAAMLLVTATTGAAQGVDAGIKGGVTFATLSDLGGGAPDTDVGLRTGLTIGGFVHLPLTGAIGFQPEVFFSQNGASLDVGGSGNEVTVKLDDLEIPLLFNFGAGSGGAYFLAGPTLTFNMRAKLAVNEDELDLGDGIRSTNVGVTVGAGLQGRPWLVEGRFTQGLRDVGVSETDYDEGVRRRAFTILAGFRF